MRCYSALVFSLIVSVTAAQPQQSTSTMEQQQAPPVLTRTPGDLLKGDPPKGPSLPGFYNEIPANLEQGVRYAAEENYTTASVVLEKELAAAKDPRERARIMMWMGIVNAQNAMDYESASGVFGVATSVTLYLREAIKLDPEVFKAPDVARTLGQMYGSGWARDPAEPEMEQALQKAEKERSAIHYYYAGIIQQRMTERSYGYTNTQKEDEKTLGLLARSIALEPGRYETWPAYLSVVGRLGMVDLLTSDGEKMYKYFKNLRAPVMGDPGPAALYLRTRVDVPHEIAESFLNELIKEHPEDPYPRFALGIVGLSTSPTLGAQRFEKFLADVDSGNVKLLPREHGYRISALYKLGFAYMHSGELAKAMETYNKVRTVNPKYAETYFNMAECYQRMADRETTGPKKLELLEKAVSAAIHQEDVDYMGRASAKADGYRRTLSREVRRVRNELGLDRRNDGTTIPQPSKPLRIEF